MAANANWVRWIFASFAKWFDSKKENLNMLVDGDDDQLISQWTNYFEFRINGPIITEPSKDFWCIDVVVNLLIVAKRDEKDLYNLQRAVGQMAAAFAKAIPMYEYGDSGNLFGCMQLHTKSGEAIEIFNIGQVSSDIKEMQTLVQGIYRMYLEV